MNCTSIFYSAFLCLSVMACSQTTTSDDVEAATESVTELDAQIEKEFGKMKFPEGIVQLIVRAEDTDWKPCPPNLPEGCNLAVLEGNPKGDDLFTIRFLITKDFIMPAHTHPKDERVTIIRGKAYVAFGKGATKEEAAEFGPGDYYVNARNEIHTVWADSSTIIQITGVGPWEADFID